MAKGRAHNHGNMVKRPSYVNITVATMTFQLYLRKSTAVYGAFFFIYTKIIHA